MNWYFFYINGENLKIMLRYICKLKWVSVYVQWGGKLQHCCEHFDVWYVVPTYMACCHSITLSIVNNACRAQRHHITPLLYSCSDFMKSKQIIVKFHRNMNSAPVFMRECSWQTARSLWNPRSRTAWCYLNPHSSLPASDIEILIRNVPTYLPTDVTSLCRNTNESEIMQ